MSWKIVQRCALVSFCLQASLMMGQTIFTVSPANQPDDSAASGTLKLYSDLNQKLAASTDEPASSCLKSFADYQACKAGEKPKKCGHAPKCTATAPLPQMDMAEIKLHFPLDKEEATLEPLNAPTAAPAKTPRDIKIMHEDGAAPPAPPMGVAGMSGGAMAGTTAGNGSAPEIVKARGPVRISGGVEAGLVLSRKQPVYPPVAKVMHLSGTVVLRAMITKSGTIDSLEVMSTTSPLFDVSAIDAVHSWKYQPYVLNGEPTAVDTTITVNYILNGK